DRDARLADIALDARVITVVAAVCGEIEGDGQALLSRGKISAVEGVRRFRRREAGILPDRPRAAGIHGGPWPAHERLEPWQAVEVVHPFQILRRVERLDVDALDGMPQERL